MPERFYITTAIHYVNDEPHIGHAFETVAADVLARYNRLFGRETFFLTGTDEHGQKLQDTAVAKGIPPKEYCDQIVTRFLDVWQKLNISYDNFIRTTEKRHIEVVRHILQKLFDAGEIYKSSYEGWYCKYEERFWTEKDLVEGNCPDCNRPVTKISEENYFFKMSQYQQWLVDYINQNPEFIKPEFRKNEVLGYLRQPLSDLCISRPKSRLSWGIELPFDKDYVCYVWFDALLNYITGPGYLSDPDAFKKWWPSVTHLIGKDIITTHAVYWPCMLKAAGIPVPKTIFAHGFWLMEDAKMSKSRGNVVKPLDIVAIRGGDAFRYFVIREMTMGQDASYSEDAFIQRYNSDLANDFGNLVSRLSKMIAGYTDGRLPEPATYNDEDVKIKLGAQELLPQVIDLVDSFKLNVALEQILQSIRALNRYVENNRPWDLHKQGNTERLNTVLYTASEGLRIAARLLFPVIPEKIEEFADIFNAPIDALTSNEAAEWGWMKPGTEVKPGVTLFPRIDKKEIKKVAEEKAKSEPEGIIELDDFKKLKLKVAEIFEAVKVEGADKLLKLQIDLGSEKRQIIAGIAEYYKPEELVGKKIVVLTNLKPAKIRGVESNGMLLAASKKNQLTLVTVDDDIPNGSSIG
ncbi:MAG: methionine--tRNA ligase [candidate division Zixibacteria bacterium]|nr:methionine--tRNA ligase [candidate division Zixibacteria bacterium]